MRVLTLVLIGLLSACGAVMSGGKQSVTVITPDVDGAACSLTDSKGRVWYVENTPGTALVKKGAGPITVICKKEGYEVGTGEIQDNFAMASAGGNLALGPAAPIGYFIDNLTGSSQKYESNVSVDMEPLSKKTDK